VVTCDSGSVVPIPDAEAEAIAWVSSVHFLLQLSPSPFDGFQASCEFPRFRVEVGQLLLKLLFVQVIRPALLSNEGFDFMSQEAKPRVTVHAAFTELQLACSYRSDDLWLRKAEFLASRLVAQSGPFCDHIESPSSIFVTPRWRQEGSDVSGPLTSSCLPVWAVSVSAFSFAGAGTW